MKGQQKTTGKTSSSKTKADELILEGITKDNPPATQADTLSSLQELRLYQAELEKLNSELCQAREKAEAASEKYRTFYNLAPAGYFTLDAKGRIIGLNQSGSLMIGMELSAANGLHFKQFIAPGYHSVYDSFLQSVFKKGLKQSCHLKILRKEKVSLFVHVEGLFDADENVCYVTAIDITEHVHTIENLRVSEIKFRKIYENGPFGMVMVDKNLKLIAANNSFCQMLEYAEPELIGSSINDITHPEDIDSEVPEIKKLIKGEIPIYKTIKRYISKTGKLIWGSLTVNANYNQSGEFLYNLATVEDITEKRLIEETLRKTKDRLELATHSSSIGIWDWDVVNNELLWDDQMFRLYGITKDQFPGAYEAWLNGVHPDDRQSGDENSRLAIEGIKEFDTEFRVLWPDGSIHWLKANGKVFRNDKGEAIRMVGVNYDITKRKDIENELASTTTKLEAALVSMSDAVFISDNEGSFIHFNDAFATFHKFKSKDECARTFNEYPAFLEVYLEDGMLAPVEQWAVPRALRGETATHAEYKLRRKDTGETWIGSYNFAPIKNTEGEIIGSVVTASDITDRKKEEAALRKSEQLYRSLFENMLNGFAYCQILTDENGKAYDFIYLAVNESFSKLTGLNDVTGKRVSEVIPGITTSDQALIELYGKVAGGDEPQRFETFVEAMQMWFLISVYSPASGYFVAVFDVITEQKRAEKALRENEQKYAALFENAGIPASLTKLPENVFVDINAAFETIFGFSKQEVTGKTSIELGMVKPEDQERIVKDIESKKTVLDRERTIFTKSGEKRFVSITVSAVELDGQKFAITTIHDITERKLAVETLKESEANFRNIFENSPVGKSMTGIDGSLFVNKSFCNILGYTVDELQSAHWKEISHPDDIEMSEQVIKTLLNGNLETSRFEKRYMHKNGGIVWTDTTTYLQRNSKGEPEYFITNILDITERKRADEALRESEHRYRSTLDTMMEGCQILDFNWNYIYINAAAEKHNRRLSSELIGKKYMDVWPGIRDTQVFSFIRHTMEKREVHHLENKFIFPDESFGWFDLTIQPIPQGVFILSMDITERKKAEESLVNQHLLYEDIVNTQPSGVYRIKVPSSDQWNADNWASMSGKLYSVEFVSERFCQLLKIKEQDFIDDPGIIPEMVYEEDKMDFSTRNVEALQSVSKFVWEGRMVIDSQIRWMHFESIPRWLASGEIIFTGVLSDVTEQKLAEEKIKLFNEELEIRVIERTSQLEASNKELEAFSYSVSHDLRAPLRHISGYADLLNRKYSDVLPEKGRHYVDTISGAVGQMGELIDDLLKFSRTGRQEMNKSAFEMDLLLDEVLKMIKQDTGDRTITWVVAQMPKVVGDLNLLKLVWVNLISNAVKFTRNKKVAKIEIGFELINKEFVFFVRDNGAGFDMQYAHKLFGVFQRLHSAGEYEGTGIGLANVRRIIMRHGGRTWAESKPEMGATFYFTLLKQKQD
jgi:PAS domain S-box-containing protein